MKQGPFGDADSRSVRQEIFHLSWNRKVHYRVHKNQLYDTSPQSRYLIFRTNVILVSNNLCVLCVISPPFGWQLFALNCIVSCCDVIVTRTYHHPILNVFSGLQLINCSYLDISVITSYNFWYVTPYSPFKVSRRFGRTCHKLCLLHAGYLLGLFDAEDAMSLRNVGWLNYMLYLGR
jgi:hypothetical protein